MKKLLLSIAILAIAACTTPQNPAQAVYQITNNYAAALSVAVAYKRLPSCDQPAAPVLCSKVSIVKKLQDADDTAFPLLRAATIAVARFAPAPGARTVFDAAQNAVDAFASITAKLAIK